MLILTDAEWEIMKILWSQDSSSLSSIVKHANEKGMPWAMNTVHTLLSRLVKKNAVTVNKSAAPHIYIPLVEEQQCEVEEASRFLNRIYDGSISRMFSSLIQSESISKEELSKLERLIHDYNEEEGK